MIKHVARPYEHTAIAALLRTQIDKLNDIGITQREIAADAGYEKPNILSMFKRGETKVPLNKVVQLAKALKVDPLHFFRLAAQQPDMPLTVDDIEKLFPNTVSAGEMKLIAAIREANKDIDFNPTDDQVRRTVEIFKTEERTGVSPVPKSL